jgi:hypothetical protein
MVPSHTPAADFQQHNTNMKLLDERQLTCTTHKQMQFSRQQVIGKATPMMDENHAKNTN